MIQIKFENRHLLSDPNQRCKITVDGTDFRIQEPIPFNPNGIVTSLRVQVLGMKWLSASKQVG